MKTLTERVKDNNLVEKINLNIGEYILAPFRILSFCLKRLYYEHLARQTLRDYERGLKESI